MTLLLEKVASELGHNVAFLMDFEDGFVIYICNDCGTRFGMYSSHSTWHDYVWQMARREPHSRVPDYYWNNGWNGCTGFFPIPPARSIGSASEFSRWAEFYWDGENTSAVRLHGNRHSPLCCRDTIIHNIIT